MTVSDYSITLVSLLVVVLALGFALSVPIMRSIYARRMEDKMNYERKISKLKSKTKKIKGR